MTLNQLENRIVFLVSTERKITLEILHLINEAEDRGLHLARGFSSLYEWLTKGLKYSGGAAHRRITAARALRSVPNIQEKIQSGDLNLTTVSQAARAMKAHEKITGEKLSVEEQADVLSQVEGKTSAETEKTLFSIFPETAEVPPETRKIISEVLTRLAMNLDENATADLEFMRNAWAHIFPDGEAGLIFSRLLKQERKREEERDARAIARYQRQQAKKSALSADSASSETTLGPTNPPTQPVTATGLHRDERGAHPAAPSQHRPIGRKAARRVVFRLANRRCEFTDPKTGRVCGSAVWIESDHIEPRALSGSDDLENRRCLCSAHNRFEAERKLGNLYSWRR